MRDAVIVDADVDAVLTRFVWHPKLKRAVLQLFRLKIDELLQGVMIVESRQERGKERNQDRS